MNKCSRCEKNKSLDSFYIDKRNNKPRSYCKSCQKNVNSEWVEKNRDKVRSANRRYQLTHKLKNKYGISEEEYLQAVADADGKCNICKEKRKLFIDHCHKSGKFRGLLCSQCNSALGMLEDSVDRLESAKIYLKAHMM